MTDLVLEGWLPQRLVLRGFSGPFTTPETGGSIITLGLGTTNLLTFGYGAGGGATANDYLDLISQTIAQRLLDFGVFPIVGISYQEMPSLQMLPDFQCVLLPAEGYGDLAQVEGAGRYASGYTDMVKINIYGRNALDRAYLDTSLLTDATLGLLVKVQQTFDSLQLFLPVANGVALTQEPIRLAYITEPTKYPRSPEWSFTSLVFEVKASFSLDTTTIVP